MQRYEEAGFSTAEQHSLNRRQFSAALRYTAGVIGYREISIIGLGGSGPPGGSAPLHGAAATAEAFDGTDLTVLEPELRILGELGIRPADTRRTI